MRKQLLLGVAALALIAAPITQAEAHPWGWHHGGGGPVFAVGAAVGAVAGAALTLATLPFQAVAAVAAPPGPVYATPEYPGPAPVAYAAPVPMAYAAPMPVAYPAPIVVGGYYGPRPVAVYGYPHYGYTRVGYYGHGYRRY